MGDDITIGVTEIVNNIEVTAQPNDQIVDISVTDNADNVTLNITPTVVEVNINKGSSFAQWGDLYGTLSDQTDLQNALNLKANLVDGKVPASELPSYVDDIIEVANYAALPATGEIGKIYVTLDNNKIYRWSGSIYIEIASNSAIWGAITGTLTDQTDLVTALNAKQNTITLTTTGTTGAATLVGSTLNIPNYTTDISGLVPYTGATTNVDLGTYKLTASDLVINHASGSGVAASITKGGNGEALTVVKSSGTGNAASITGGTTLISELHLTTDLADDYIASAATWNAKQAALNGTGFVKISGTTISYDNTTYLSGTVAIANGGTGATTADAALTNLGGTTVGKNIFTSANPSPYTSAYLKVKPDNSVEWLEANAFRIAIGAGTGNGTVTSVEAVGGYGGLTLTGTVTGSGQLTLGGTPEGNWPINITGNASSVNTVQVSTNADFYLTFADANNGSPTSEFLYTIGTVKVNPSTGALTAGSFVKSGGTSSQFLKADGSIDSTTYQTALTNPVTGTGTTNYIPKFTGASAIGNSLIYDNGTNVGIGTTSPRTPLEVFGNGLILSYSTSNAAARDYLIATNYNAFGDFVINQANANGGNPYSAGTTRFAINAAGNVGIGTTSPSEKLTVAGNVSLSGDYNIGIDITTSGNSKIGRLDRAYLQVNRSDFEGFLSFHTTSSGAGSLSERMRITSGGNVGIGTSSPAGKLNVLESGTLSGLSLPFEFTSTSTAVSGWKFGITESATKGILFGSRSSVLSIGTINGSNFAILPDGGNVGIGTTSPTFKLDILSSGANTRINSADANGSYLVFANNGTAKAYIGSAYHLFGSPYNVANDLGLRSDAAMSFSTGGSTGRMHITSGGNVGIGIVPQGVSTFKTLEIGSRGVIYDNNDNFAFVNNGYNDGSWRYKQTGAATLMSTDSGSYVFYNAPSGSQGSSFSFTERMRITSGGDVGIGTTSPSSRFHVDHATIDWCSRFTNNSKSLVVLSHGDGYGMAIDSVTNTDLVYLLKLAGGNGTSSGSVERFKVGGTGNVTASGTVTASGGFFNSDMRLKDLIDYEYNVSDIKPITYLWKDGRDNKKHVGYSAQEVKKVMPDAVNEGTDGMLSINYVEVLVAKIAELENRIKQLEK